MNNITAKTILEHMVKYCGLCQAKLDLCNVLVSQQCPRKLNGEVNFNAISRDIGVKQANISRYHKWLVNYNFIHYVKNGNNKNSCTSCNIGNTGLTPYVRTTGNYVVTNYEDFGKIPSKLPAYDKIQDNPVAIAFLMHWITTTGNFIK